MGESIRPFLVQFARFSAFSSLSFPIGYSISKVIKEIKKCFLLLCFRAPKALIMRIRLAISWDPRSVMTIIFKSQVRLKYFNSRGLHLSLMLKSR